MDKTSKETKREEVSPHCRDCAFFVADETGTNGCCCQDGKTRNADEDWCF